MRLSFSIFGLLLSCTCIAVCQSDFPTADSLVKQAESAYQSKHYHNSAELYASAMQLLPDTERAGTEYNMARSQALAGEQNAAMTTLSRAVEDGYSDRKNTELDKDLLSLHAEPSWNDLLARMANVQHGQEERWGDKAFKTPYAPDLSAADKVAGLSELWAQAKYGFANFWHVPQLNWDQTYRDYIPKVLNTSSTLSYYSVLQRFYAQLQDGHSNVYFPTQIYDQMARLPIRTRLVDGHMLVLASRDPEADLQGIKPGDEVLAINGEGALSWAEKTIGPFVSASSPQDRATRIFEYMPFIAPISTVFTLEVQSPAGRTTKHSFTLAEDKRLPVPVPFAFRMLSGNIAYVALNEFEDDVDAKQWDEHWSEISKSDGIILDLRENGGGSSSIGSHVLATLIDKPALGPLSRSTRWIATYRAWGVAETPERFPDDMISPDEKRHYGGKVVMLTSSRTFSAGEDMVVAFRQAKRGLIIGEPSGGSTGQPLMFDLPGGGKARICTKHDSFANEKEFVGVGVQPDVAAHLSREDIVHQRDSILDGAAKEVQQNR